MCGDFNLPRVSWVDNNCDDCAPAIASKFFALSSFAAYARLNQVNNVSNIFGSMLDLVFSNVIETNIHRYDITCTPKNVYHPTLTFLLSQLSSSPSFNRDNSSKYCYNKADYDMFVDLLQAADWSAVLASRDVNFCVQSCTEIVNGAKEATIPRMSQNHHSFPIWFSKELRLELCKKKLAHKRYIAHRRAEDYQRFSALRSRTKALLKRDRCKHFNKIANEVNTKPKAFWKFLSPHFCDAYYDITLQEDESLVTDPDQICDKFGEFFEATVNQSLPVDSTKVTVAPDAIVCPVDIFSATAAKVISASKRLRPFKSTGPDGIPPFLLEGLYSYSCSDFSLYF